MGCFGSDDRDSGSGLVAVELLTLRMTKVVSADQEHGSGLVAVELPWLSTVVVVDPSTETMTVASLQSS